jgi:hypothetical protein
MVEEAAFPLQARACSGPMRTGFSEQTMLEQNLERDGDPT